MANKQKLGSRAVASDDRENLTTVEVERPLIRLTALRTEYDTENESTRWGNYLRLGKCWLLAKEIDCFPGELDRFKDECKFRKLKFNKGTPLLQRVCRYVLHNEDAKKVNNYAAALLAATDTFETPEAVAEWLKNNGGLQKSRSKSSDNPVAEKLRKWRLPVDGNGEEVTIPRAKVPMKHKEYSQRQIVVLLTESENQLNDYAVTCWISETAAVDRLINIMAKHVKLEEIVTKPEAKKAA
jgi:hypothetical protein